MGETPLPGRDKGQGIYPAAGAGPRYSRQCNGPRRWWRENRGFAGREGQAHQALAGDFKIGIAFGRDLDDAALAGERSGDIHIAVDIESQSLWTSEAAIEDGDGSVRINFVNGVETGSGGSGDKQIALRAEGEMIGGDAGLERGKDEDLAVARDLENRSAAVADVEVFFAIESDAGGDAHAFGIRGHGSVGRDLVNGFVVARGDIHLTFAVEGDGGRVHHVVEERRDVVVGVDLEDGDGNFSGRASPEKVT